NTGAITPRPIGQAGGGGGGGGGGGAGDDEDSGAWDRVQSILEGLGLSQGAIEAIIEALRKSGKLPDEGLLAVLGNDQLMGFIKGAGVVLDIVGVIVDFATDYIDHPNLPTDERIIHALYDTALRFAMSEGVEAGVTWLMAAAGSVVPVLGTAVGAAVGKVVGWALGEAVEFGLDKLDEHTDFVDKYADTVVEGYRAAKQGAEWVSDRVDDIKDGAGKVVDGAKDVAGKVGQGARDAAGKVGGGIKSGYQNTLGRIF
ncbi:MAG TPA: hypothetical protein PLV68_18310, partial [Ilumatobacteraceae bacterium]|nr:hypothetical protein [Ilumatobacteraceae bacterium]